MAAETDPVILIKQLDRACRIGFLVVTALFAYCAIRLSFSISQFEAIFRDMLAGRSLPALTSIIITGRAIFLSLSLILPAFAVFIAFRIRRSDHAVIGISFCSFVLLLLAVIMWTGLTAPLFSICSALTEGTQ